MNAKLVETTVFGYFSAFASFFRRKNQASFNRSAFNQQPYSCYQNEPLRTQEHLFHFNRQYGICLTYADLLNLSLRMDKLQRQWKTETPKDQF